jgi:acyl carrier protein
MVEPGPNEARLRQVVIEALQTVAPDADVAVLDPARTFHDQFDIDSVDFINLILTLEKRLGVRIAETDYPKLSSLEGCLAHLAATIPQDVPENPVSDT